MGLRERERNRHTPYEEEQKEEEEEGEEAFDQGCSLKVLRRGYCNIDGAATDQSRAGY